MSEYEYSSIYFTKQQKQKLKDFAKFKGLYYSELVRRILDEWLDKETEKLKK